jgi:Luciferase-like monooxygenase
VAAWAAITTRIRIGTLIINLSWRSPVLVARSAAAIDQVSGGRFELFSAQVLSRIGRWQECSRCHRANGSRGLLRARR